MRAEGHAIDRLIKECVFPHKNIRFNERCFEAKTFGGYITYARASVEHKECDQTKFSSPSSRQIIENKKLTNVHRIYIQY